MNSFETDLKRAIGSLGFWAGLILEVSVLFFAGFTSDLFRACVPVLAALPYGTAWLNEYQSGYLKAYLPRTNVRSYIAGKFLACGISGGLLEALGVRICRLLKPEEAAGINEALIFASGMLWAVLAAALAAWAGSRCIAYGGSFVLYYFLVISYERYFADWYCLYPYEWLAPAHPWVFGETGVLVLLLGWILVVWCLYYFLLKRCSARL